MGYGGIVPRKPSTKKLVKNSGLIDFVNSAAFSPFGFPLPSSTELSQLATLFQNERWYLLSNNRLLLSEMYMEHGLVQTVVGVPVDDGFKGGVEIKTKQLDDEDIANLQTSLDRDSDLIIMAQAQKWKRLYGGAGVIVETAGQDYSTPFDINKINPDTPVSFIDADMWELLGADGSNENTFVSGIITSQSEFYDYYGKKLHRSRVMVLKGIRAPSFLRPRLRGWGFSVMEALVRSINQYLKANNLTFEVLDEFKVDYYKIKNLSSDLLDPNAEALVRRRIAIANQQKNFQHAVVMDGEDDFQQKQLSFTGLAEAMVGIRMAIASDLRMPLTKLFGVSASGFSSGEDDIENYNAMIEAEIRHTSKYDLIRMIQIKCKQMFDILPDDLSIAFKPLRMLSAEQEETVKSQQFNRLLAAQGAGLISPIEFKNAVNKLNLLGIQVDASTDSLYEVKGDEEESGPAAEKKKNEMVQ